MKPALVASAVVFMGLTVAHAQSPTLPSDAEVRQVLVDRIDRDHQGVGIVVGLVDAAGRRVVAYGALNQGDPRTLDGNTIFEIGSITKVFTSLLLADMAGRGELALSDPIAKFLPPNVKTPERNGRSITLVDLATHTSGLPRLPTNMRPKDVANPYADYTVGQLYDFLSSYVPTRDIGAQYEYSNVGDGLLGHLLARRAGMDYDALIRARIVGPLGMTNTDVQLTPAQQLHFATGHNAQLAAVPNWDLPTLAGAGAIRSTANDLLTLLEAALGVQASSLEPAMKRMLITRRSTGIPGLEIALGWHILSRTGREIIWHDGGTGGFRSFIGYDTSARTGVVVLSNASTAAGVDDIGLHLLDPSSPLAPPPSVHTEVAINPKLLDGYVGRYQVAPTFILTITREGSRLFVQATNQPRLEVFAEGDARFFLKVVDAQLTFVTDAEGRATSVVLHQNGRDITGMRLD